MLKIALLIPTALMLAAMVYSVVSQTQQRRALVEMMKAPGVVVYVGGADGKWHRATPVMDGSGG